jgi:YD repeat-containing protein
VQIVYNGANLPTQVTDERGIITKYTYTLTNDIQTETVGFGTALAATTTFNYNAAHFLQSVVDPLNHAVASYTYDTFGRVKAMTDGDNVTTTYDYDAVGRLSKVHDPRLTGGTNYVQYKYNDNDQVTSIVAPTGTTLYQYDPTTHRLTSVTDPSGNVTQYAYDATTGQLLSTTQVAGTNSATTQLTYDRVGNLTLVIAPNGDRTAFRYDALGRGTAMIEDNLSQPMATVTPTKNSPTTLHVALNASEPILVASLTYWQTGQSQSTAVTTSQRVSDASQLAFDLSGIDPTKTYNYQITLTDRTGHSQATSPSLLVLPGDYNVNGVVDSSDYVLWRKTLNQTGVTPYTGADGNGSGSITQADFGVWRGNFGATALTPVPGTGTETTSYASAASTNGKILNNSRPAAAAPSAVDLAIPRFIKWRFSGATELSS